MKKHAIVTAAILALLFLAPGIQAQQKWNPGYIVKHSGDTLKGLIYYRHQHKSPLFIRFKIDNADTGRVYKPIDIASFGTKEGKQDIYYGSFIVDMDYTPTNLAQLKTSPEPDLIKDTVFAQLLIGDVKSLYFNEDCKMSKKHYLVETGPGKAKDLVNNSYYTNENRDYYTNENRDYYTNENRDFNTHNEEYKKQLWTYMSDCKIVTINRINELGFSEKKLKRLFEDYGQCGNPEKPLKYKLVNEKIKGQFGVVAGTSISSLKLSNSYIPFISQFHFKFSPGPAAGIFLNLVSPHTDHAWSFYNELIFTQYDVKSNPGNYFIDILRKAQEAEIKATYLKLFTTIRYQFPYASYKPFLELGIGNGFSISNSNNYTYETSSLSGLPPTFSKAQLLDFRSYEQSFCIGTGLNYHKFGAELRFENGNGMSTSNGIKSSTYYFHFLLSYKIK